MVAGSIDDFVVFARTVWGEARGEPELGQEAVAWVIVNRLRSGYRGAETLSDVCRARLQFSCWNPDDPNAALLDRVNFTRTSFCRVFAAVCRVWSGEVPDPTNGARHYHNHRVAPAWSRGHHPTAVIGNHVFYDDIA
ncbi:MAG TPA: cell wall hydrolase [Alphaproteobacteria bacterium]|nr:cell wall hydrolase [Alphaproteobacteria bacterium]